VINDVLTAILDVVEGVSPWLRTLIASVAMMLETSILVGLVVPGDTIVIVTATGVTSLLEGIVLGAFVVAGAFAGETIGYMVGRWAGPWLRRSRVGGWIGERNWALTVGMSGYPYRKFVAWTLPACALWAAIYISIAAGAAETYRDLSGSAHWAGYAFFGIILAGLLLIFAGKKILGWFEHRHMKD
jgi:membrane protein DedA with SNARE-associated domain